MATRNGSSNGHKHGVSLAKLLRDSKTIGVDFGDETVQVTYRPQFLTPVTESLLREITDEAEPLRRAAALAKLMPQLVSEWDLTEDEDGPAIALTEERLQTVPSGILVDIMLAVQRDITPNPTNAAS
jgi:hypothetical protein